MLVELRVQNFAIIDKLEIQFDSGFNVITGETGAGKSIIIDAVEMLLGGRADADLIRAGSDRATIEGVFKVAKSIAKDVQHMLQEEGIEFGTPADELVLTREIRTNGRNICRINGSNASLHFFRELGERMVDIHGQSEHLSLLKPRHHLGLLDRYANLQDQRSAVAALVNRLNGIRTEIANLEQDEAAIARRIDMLNYQIEEVRAVDPELGEEEVLKEERIKLANAEQLATFTADVANLLLDGDDDRTPSAVDLLNQAALALAKLAKIDAAFEEHQQLAESLAVQAEEMARSVRSYYDHVEYNPARLAEVEERLEAFNRLKKKYGGSIEAVLAYAQKAQQDLNDITHSEERLETLREQENQLLYQIGDLAMRLSQARQKAAKILGQNVETEMQELRMEGARFEVAVMQQEDPNGCYVGEQRFEFDSTGMDHVEFMIAANRGEPLRALVKVASGGETARIMLAMKGVLSRADSTPTLIFDEIDQGIGGRVGAMVGQKLWSLAENHQVLCVTHLAQLAGYGDTHFKVTKGERGQRIVTSITPLDDRGRVAEMAEMLGAETPTAMQSAHDILMMARRTKEGKGVQSPLL